MSHAPTHPLTPQDLALLREDTDLFHLLFHRNKNQHRLAKWWQWLGTLRRHLRCTIQDSDRITNAKSTPELASATERLGARIVFMRNVVVPGAYKAFRTVLADKQFVALGCVLVAVLARVWKVIGDHGKADGVVIEDTVLEQQGEVMAIDEQEGVVINRSQYEVEQSEANLDVFAKGKDWNGDSVAVPSTKPRKHDTGMISSRTASTWTKKRKPNDDERDRSDREMKKIKEKKKERNRRKKEDSIDALFSGIF